MEFTYNLIKMSNSSDLEVPIWATKKRDAATGPWFSTVKLAISSDGLNFEKTHRVLVDRGSVSNFCLDSKGRIIASYQYFSFLQESKFDKIAVSISSDNGETWEGPTIVQFNVNKNEKLTAYNPVDPTMVLLDNGKLRLYFTSGFVPGPEFSGIVGCVSAISNNGIDFKVEEGYRFTLPEGTVLDPAVLKIRDEWHHYCPQRRTHAVSSDGLNFKRVEDIALPPDIYMLGNAIPFDDGYRFYLSTFNRKERVRMVPSAFSKDGYTWTMDPGMRIVGGGDGGVIRMKNGKYLMSYSTWRKA